MITCLRWRWLVCLAGSVALVLGGCRDTEPTPPHYRDLGDGDRILLPPGSPWYELADKDRGSADWVPFREPGSEEEAEGGEAVADSSDDGGPAEGGPEGIEADIREVIDEYNEFVADGDFEELLDFHVETQRDTIKAMFDAAGVVLEKLEALRAALKEKLPDEPDRIDAAVDLLAKSVGSPELNVASLTVVGEAEVIGKPPAGSMEPECRFKLVDGEWYIEFPALPDYAQLKPAMDMLLGTFEAWVQALRSGQSPGGMILQQVELQAKTLAAAQGQVAPSPGDQEAKTTDESPGGEADEDAEGG